MNSIGLIIFAYNRPDCLEKCIVRLKANTEYDSITKFFFIDGPKDGNDRKKQLKIKKILDKFKDKSTHIFFSKKNHGLKKSIISGINYVFKIKRSAIIIEDDIIVGKFFLNFIINSLRLTKNKNKIFSVSGYSYPHNIKGISKNYYFLERSCSWGWAIHKKNWKKIIFDQEKIKRILDNDKSNKLKKKFTYLGGENFYKMLTYSLNNKISSWAVYLLFTQIFYNKLTLYPRFSLTKNIGHDGNGTNSLKTTKWDNKNYINKRLVISSVKNLKSNIIITKSVIRNFKISFKEKILNEAKNFISSFKTFNN